MGTRICLTIQSPIKSKDIHIGCHRLCDKVGRNSGFIKIHGRIYDKFIFELFVRYGLPREVITDGGAQCVGNKITATLNNHHIIHRLTSPYNPQANGQVESTNKVLEAILTKTVLAHHWDWATRLPEALWAYHTTW